MFSSGKKSSGGTPARTTSKGGAGGLSFIGPDVLISGDVTASGQVHIDGRVDGNVRCETLVQGDGGTIAGHIQADTAHLSGLVGRDTGFDRTHLLLFDVRPGELGYDGERLKQFYRDLEEEHPSTYTTDGNQLTNGDLP